MTTTGEDIPPCEGGIGHFTEPLRVWLIANGVDWDNTVSWPELRFSDDGTSFEVEQFYRDDRGQLALMRGDGGSILVTRVAYPLAVPIDPELLRAYEYTRPGALIARDQERWERWLRLNPPAVSVNNGDTLIFATIRQVGGDELARARTALEQVLPHVKILVVSGFDSIMKASGSDVGD